MKNKTVISVLIMLPILIGIVSACSCIFMPEVQDRFDNAEYVFTMKVEEVDLKDIGTGEEMQEATVKIIQYWKPSEFPESVNLKIYSTKDTGANCGYNLEKDQEYLIYAYKDLETGNLQTNSCMGSINLVLEQAQSEINELNQIIEPVTNSNPEPVSSNIFTKLLSWIKDLFS